MMAIRPVIAPNGGTLPPNEIGRIAENVREGEGKKERKDGLSLKGTEYKCDISY